MDDPTDIEICLVLYPQQRCPTCPSTPFLTYPPLSSFLFLPPFSHDKCDGRSLMRMFGALPPSAPPVESSLSVMFFFNPFPPPPFRCFVKLPSEYKTPIIPYKNLVPSGLLNRTAPSPSVAPPHPLPSCVSPPLLPTPIRTSGNDREERKKGAIST